MATDQTRRDAEAYRKFHNFLLKRENITQMQTWNVLDTPVIMCMLLSKLPGGTRDKWSRRVLLIRRNQPLPQNLYKNYIKCIQKLSKTLNLYIFCIQRLYK